MRDTPIYRYSQWEGNHRLGCSRVGNGWKQTHIEVKSPWMHMVIDHVRFRRRIHHSELILAPILNHKHRLMIYIKRYDI